MNNYNEFGPEDEYTELKSETGYNYSPGSSLYGSTFGNPSSGGDDGYEPDPSPSPEYEAE